MRTGRVSEDLRVVVLEEVLGHKEMEVEEVEELELEGVELRDGDAPDHGVVGVVVKKVVGELAGDDEAVVLCVRACGAQEKTRERGEV